MGSLEKDGRVTLERALQTVTKMLYTRGFRIMHLGDHLFPGGATPTDPAVAVAVADFGVPDRCRVAEQQEVVVLGQVVGDPEPGSMAAAHGLASGAQIAVVAVTTGRVSVVRDVTLAVRDLYPAAVSVVLIGRMSLTSFTTRNLGGMCLPVQFFNYTDLQYCVIDHALVLRHKAMDAQQRADIDHETSGSCKLPALRESDPVIKFLGLVAGDIVEVLECMGKMAPFTTFFRVKPAVDVVF